MSDKGNYNMFAPAGALKEGNENKENEGDKDEDKKDDKKDKVSYFFIIYWMIKLIEVAYWLLL